MRTRTLVAGLAGLAALTASALPAAAIKYGEPDNGEHPYVGLMISYVWVDDGDGVQSDDELFAGWRCSGTQIDADTFLTAGHCTDGADAVAIWYADDLLDVQSARDFITLSDAIDQTSDVAADAWSYDALSHPDYDPNAFYLHDAGVVDEVILAPGTTFDTYGQLPEHGYWDDQLALNKKQRDSYDTVGYGLQWAMPTRGQSDPNENNQARTDQADWVKLQAGGELLGARQFGGGKGQDAYVVLTNNADTGGTCSGDSGGPTFVEGTTVVVAVTSFGVNETCAGTSGVYRIDTADDLAWIGSFVD